jgi:hypothetical protein
MSENKPNSGGTSYNQHSSGRGDNVAGNKTTHLNIRNVTVFILIAGVALILIIYSIHQYRRQKEINRQEAELRNQQDSLKTAELMSSVKSSYEIKYVTLEGNAIDFLLDSNKINNAEILEVFGNKPLILTTPVTNYLLALRKLFGLKPEFTNYELVRKNIAPNESEEAKIKMTGGKILPATNPFSNQGFEAGPVSVNDLTYRFNFDSKCIADSTPGYPNEKNAGCHRFATKENIERLLNYFDPSSDDFKTLKFYLYTAGSNKFPSDFFEMRNGYMSGECGGDEAGYRYIRISSPILKLKVAYIKNTSSLPIKLTDLLFSNNNYDGLRSISDDSLGSGKADTVKYHITLPPGKSLIIPVHTYFEAAGIEDTGGEPVKTESDPALPKYVFGNSIQIESLRVNDFLFAANNEYNAKEYGFYVNGIAEGASCPYIFTYDSSQQNFMKETNILYAQNKKSKEGWDTIRLKHFDGRLQIKEIDPETSFIDCIYILARSKNGTDKIYKPDSKALISRNYSYQKLTQGDSFMLNFPTFNKRDGDSYFVISSGYYIPWQ